MDHTFSQKSEHTDSVPVQAGCTEGIFLTVSQFKKQIYVYLQEKTVSKKNIEQKKGVTIAP